MNRLTPTTKRWARENRRQPTRAERVLWEALRRRQVDEYHFRRQAPLLGFIVDFYCARAQLVVEVDGVYHKNPEQLERDAQRTAALKARAGVNVIRFSNEAVLTFLPSVVKAIRVALRWPRPKRTRARRVE